MEIKENKTRKKFLSKYSSVKYQLTAVNIVVEWTIEDELTTNSPSEKLYSYVRI